MASVDVIMIASTIEHLLTASSVDDRAVESAVGAIMSGEVGDIETAGLLVALRKHERNGAILAACARAMRSHRRAIHAEVRPLIDTCGTGGDRSGTFNISTTTAFIVAAAGGAVAKHGNRSVSSKSGSADVLEAAGARLDLQPHEATELLNAVGFVFLFAPKFHPAMARVGPIRRALGIRTLFNLLGPLTNPALAERQLIGVFDPALTEVVAEALRTLGTESALVVHCDGLDEVGLHAPTHGHRVREGRIEPFTLEPLEFGLARSAVADISGDDAPRNAALMRAVLEGERGARSDVVAINAACALEVAGVARTVGEGLDIARDLLHSGSGARILRRYIESTNRVGAR